MLFFFMYFSPLQNWSNLGIRTVFREHWSGYGRCKSKSSNLASEQIWILLDILPGYWLAGYNPSFLWWAGPSGFSAWGRVVNGMHIQVKVYRPDLKPAVLFRHNRYKSETHLSFQLEQNNKLDKYLLLFYDIHNLLPDVVTCLMGELVPFFLHLYRISFWLKSNNVYFPE